MKIIFDIVSMDASNGDVVFNNEFVEKDFESISKKIGYFSNVLLEKSCWNHSLSVTVVDFFERWERS